MKRKISIVLLSLVVCITPFFFNYSHLEKCSHMETFVRCLESEIPDLLTKYKIPGASISIIENSHIKWVGTFGYKDVSNKSKMDRDTVFQVASISKPLTALGIMKLVEQGKIDLDAPIDQYVTRWKIPESSYDKKQVTIRRLLSHTSGLSNGGGYHGYSPHKGLPSIEASLDGIKGKAKPVKLIGKPGTKYNYSGGGYLLLQLLIEEVTGIDFNTYMATQIFKPAHMMASSYKWQDDLDSHIAKAYDEQLNQIPNYLYVEEAAAGLYTTIDDISEFILSEINSYHGNHDLLEQETMKLIYTPVMKISSLLGKGQVTLGHYMDEPEEGTQLITHSGSNRGWRANFTINPYEKTGIAILTNGNNGDYVINEVLNAWYHTTLNVNSFRYKLKHILSASTYSISCFLVLWSVLLLYALIKDIKCGKRKMTLLKNKYTFILKCLTSILFVYFTYLFKYYISFLLGFADPHFENVIFYGLCLRVLVGILQISFRRTPQSFL